CVYTRPGSSLDLQQVDAEVLEDRDALPPHPFEIGVTQDERLVGQVGRGPAYWLVHVVMPRNFGLRTVGRENQELAGTSICGHINIRIQQFPSGKRPVRAAWIKDNRGLGECPEEPPRHDPGTK